MMSFLKSIFGKKPDTVVVPPGHKVVVIHPSPQAYCGRAESGVWIAELGTAGDFEPIILRVVQIVAAGESASVIWILQPCVMEMAKFEALLRTLTMIVEKSQGVVGHCAVVPHATAAHAPQIRRLVEAGLGVHRSAEDGACFIEVHKPEEIVVGMPGSPFAG